jgi:hypothetical protein
MTDQIDGCLVCAALSEAIQETEHCFLIVSPYSESRQLLVSKEHDARVSDRAYQEALSLITDQIGGVVLRDEPRAVGHWAIELVPHSEMGKSKSRT